MRENRIMNNIEFTSFTDEEKNKPKMLFDLRVHYLHDNINDIVHKGVVLSSFAMTRIEAFVDNFSVAIVDNVCQVSNHIGFCTNIIYFAGYDGKMLRKSNDEDRGMVQWFLTLHESKTDG